MITNQQLSGLAVVSIDTGEKLGMIDQVAVDPSGRTIVAFTMQSGSSGMLSTATTTASWLPADQVHAVGPDAVTVQGPSALKDHIEQTALLLAGDLLKRKIITEGGVYIGDVSALQLDTRAMTVTHLEVSHGLLKASTQVPIDQLITVGHELIIAADGADNPPPDPPMLEDGNLSELEPGPTSDRVVGDVEPAQRDESQGVPSNNVPDRA